MKNILCVLLIAVLGACACAASPIVGIDVSRSMRDYGNWQEDAKRALTDIIFLGKAPDTQTWKSVGNIDVLQNFKLSGDVTVFRFGSFPTKEYPYFDSTQASDASRFVEEFPETNSFRDQKTNKPLALAVAAVLSSQNANDGYAVFVSDFLADSDVSRQHQEFINNTEAAFTQQVPLTLTWARDPRLQLKFVHFQRTTPSTNTSSQTGTITLLQAQFYSRPDRYLLRWKADSTFDRFQVRVEDAATGAVVFEKSNLASEQATFRGPPSRAMRWYVIGTNSNGESVRSAAQNLTGQASPSLFVPVLLAILVVVGLCLVIFKAQKLPSWMEGLLRRRKSEWS